MNKYKIAVLISGRGSNLEALLKYAENPSCKYKVVMVISNKPNALGLSLLNNSIVITDEETLHKVLVNNQIDFVCLAGYMKVLSKDFIKKWENKILNIHPSLLPKYKGLNTYQRALDNGDKEAGCSVHLVTEIIDSGEILAQARVTIDENDTAETLAEKILKEEHNLYPVTLEKYLLKFENNA